MAQNFWIAVARLGVFGLAVLVSILQGAAEEPSQSHNRKPGPSRLRCINCIVRHAQLIYAPKAVYPELARAARVAGEVRFEGVIGTDGTVQRLRLESGHFLLVSAAMDAAKRCRYRPALMRMDGLVPVEEVLLIIVEAKPESL